MKFLSAALLIAFNTSVYASFETLHCSNATGTVIWEQGVNNNLARLTYDGFVSGVLDVEIHKLNIEKKEEVTLRDELLSQCGASSTMTTYAARVVITPSAEHPDALQSYFPDNMISADVICEKIVSNQADCRP